MSDTTEQKPGGEPVEIRLRFPSREARDYWLGGIMDAWGENECSLDAPPGWVQPPTPEGPQPDWYQTCDTFNVLVWDGDGEIVGGDWEAEGD